MRHFNSRHQGFGICLVQLLLTVRVIAADAPGAPAPSSGGDALAPTAAAITFATTNHDFGKVVAGQTVKHEFFFTNSGNATLVIQDVQSTCGCTSAGRWTRRVEPGQTGVIPLEFFTGKFTGDISKPITVVCNDPRQPKVALEIKGNIWRPIVVLPDAAMLSGCFDGSTNSWRTLQISNATSQPVFLYDPRTNHASITAELRTNAPGQQYQLEVKLVPPFGSGNIFGEVTLKTTCAEMPILKIPVYGVPQPPILALPAQIEVPPGPLPSSLSRSVSFRNNASAPLVLSEPLVDYPEAQVQLHIMQPGQLITAIVTLPAGFQCPAGKRLELTAKSNHPQVPLLRVPIVASAAAAKAQ